MPTNAHSSRPSIRLSLDRKFSRLLRRFPWHNSLSSWSKSDAHFVQIKSGLSRHLVRFVELEGNIFAIKETSAEAAEREFQSYKRLRELGIPTLLPVGTVIREEGVRLTQTALGPQCDSPATGYLVTRLLEHALPNYHLFRRSFRKENRRRMWDVIVRLFVQLHCKNVYWGDASLSNMMIVFATQHFPQIGVRTVLRAVLADAETVECHSSISDSLRRADVDHFLESMAWTEADLQASGTIRSPLMTIEDQEYILNRYMDLYEIEREEQSFELLTEIDVDALIGPFEQRGQSRALLQHIYEHKWYLSEREKKEVLIGDAARDWYTSIFKPVLRCFAEFELLDEFPERTAASLYLDIMYHKYLLSEKVGRDVGLIWAFEEYVRQFARGDRALQKISGIAQSIRNLFVAHSHLGS